MQSGNAHTAAAGFLGLEAGSTSTERKEKFLGAHPDWEIVYVRSKDRYEASTGNTDTELVIMMDTHLGTLMDRLEERFRRQQPPRTIRCLRREFT